MKNFFIDTVLCFTILIVCFSVITMLVDNGLRKTEYENFNEWNDIFSHKIKPDLLIQGSSRAWVQYNTCIMDSILRVDSYNMGMDGSPFDVQYLRFKACLTNGIIPKSIIQNVDYETITRNKPPYQPYYFLPYMDNAEFAKQIESEKLLSTYKRIVPFLKYAGEFKIIMIGLSEFFTIHHFRSNKQKGYRGNDLKWDGANFEQRKKRGNTPFIVDNEVNKLYHDFLRECKKHNIKIVMVYAPPYHELNHYVKIESIFDYYNQIVKEYDIPFLNYFDDNISLAKTNYYNATHMNKTGAELFSTKLARDIDSLGILK